LSMEAPNCESSSVPELGNAPDDHVVLVDGGAELRVQQRA
jgi:hypothetical protein